jgi:uncharacterized low-complexity protein
MSKSRPLSTALGLALLGSLPVIAEANSSFTSTPLAAGYLLAAADTDKTAEGSCGEGACGEGMCAASMKPKAAETNAGGAPAATPSSPATPPATAPATGKTGGKHDAEGSCGEGSCGKM